MAGKKDERTAQLLELEKETLKRVSISIAKIEDAVDAWNASKDKPERLRKKVGHLERSYTRLSSWARRAATGSRKPEAVYGRLQEFAQICETIAYPGE